MYTIAEFNNLTNAPPTACYPPTPPLLATEHNFHTGFTIRIPSSLSLAPIIRIRVGTCLTTLVIRETIFTPCFRTRNCLKVLTVTCRALTLSDLKFLLTNNDLIPTWPEDKEDKFNVKVRDIKKDLLFERERISCILFTTLRLITRKVSALGTCRSLQWGVRLRKRSPVQSKRILSAQFRVTLPNPVLARELNSLPSPV